MSGETEKTKIDSKVQNTNNVLENLIDFQLKTIRIQTDLSELYIKKKTLEESIALIESDVKKLYNSSVYFIFLIQLQDTLRDIYVQTKKLQTFVVATNNLFLQNDDNQET